MRPMAVARDASHSAGFSARTGAQCPQSGHLCFEDAVSTVGDGLPDRGFELEPLADAVSCLWLGSIVE